MIREKLRNSWEEERLQRKGLSERRRFGSYGAGNGNETTKLLLSLLLSLSRNLFLSALLLEMYLNEEEAMCGKKSIYRERDGDRTVLFMPRMFFFFFCVLQIFCLFRFPFVT